MIRKILFSLLLIGALAISVFAEESAVALVSSEQTVNPGDTFTVDANLNNTEAIKLGTVALTYDEQVLELIGGECHVSGAMLAQVLPGKKAGTFFLNTAKTVSGKIFTFEFKVKENAPAGACNVSAKAAIGIKSGNYIAASGTQIQILGTNTLPENVETNPQATTIATQPQAPEETTVPLVTEPLQSETEAEPTRLPDATKPTGNRTPEGTDSKAWVIAGVAIVLFGAIVAAIILRKKKKA